MKRDQKVKTNYVHFPFSFVKLGEKESTETGLLFFVSNLFHWKFVSQILYYSLVAKTFTKRKFRNYSKHSEVAVNYKDNRILGDQ